jgi:hypothetical protein
MRVAAQQDADGAVRFIALVGARGTPVVASAR